MTGEEAVALFDRRRRAWLAEDVEGYLALWAPDMRFQSPLHLEPLDHAGFAELVRRAFATSRPISFEVTQLAVAGDVVLAEWRIVVERREGGRRVEWWGMSVCEMRDGRIHTWREYWNPADVV
jgi:ketosteroid isomerase-like protein